MTMTKIQQDNGFLLGIALFNATINFPIYSEYEKFIAAGGNVNDLYVNFTNAGLFPDTLSAEQVSNNFLSSLTASYLDSNTFNNIKGIMVNELNAGMARGTLFNIVINALNGVDEADTTFGQAAKYLHKKVEVAKYYTLTLNGEEGDIIKLQKYISTVTANSDVTTPDKINDLIKDLIIEKDGQTINLTVNGETLMGGLGDDTFYAKSVYDSNNKRIDLFTLGGNDIIDGNIGNDTLIVDYGVDVIGSQIAGTNKIKNIEKIQVIQSSTKDNLIKVDLGGLINGQTLEIINNGGNSNVHVQTYKNISEVIVKGKNSTIGIYELDSTQTTGLKKVSIDTTEVLTGVVNLNLGSKSLETLTINGSGNVPVVIDGLKNSPNLLQIIANTDITMTQELNVKAMFTGSDKKENIVIGNHESSIDFKGGDDTLKINSTVLDKNIKIDGGAGIDTLVLAVNYAQGLSANKNFNNTVTRFEKLQLVRDEAKSIEMFSINMNNLNSIRVVELKEGNEKLTLNNFVTTGELTLDGYAGDLIITNQLIQSIQPSMTINLNSKTGMTTKAGSITNNTVEVLTINSKDTDLTNKNVADSIKTELTATNLKALILNGDMNIDLGTFATKNNNINNFNSTLNIVDTEMVSFTFANTTDNIKVTSGNHKSTYDTVANNKNNTFELGALKDIVITGNGDNIINGGGGDDEITTGSGNDTITVGNGNAIINSGTGADLVTLGTGDYNVIFNVNGSEEVFTEIANIDKKDTITFVGETGLTFNQTKVALAPGATFTNYLNEATKNSSSQLSWFQFNNDTYIVLDKNAGATFMPGDDGLIKLTGVVDLSASAISNSNLII